MARWVGLFGLAAAMVAGSEMQGKAIGSRLAAERGEIYLWGKAG
jgi:hypothetical protein